MDAVTEQLEAWRAGDQDAYDSLLPEVYAAMRRIAGHLMVAERAEHTLEPTALAHEAWLKLAGHDTPCKDRAHFLALAARAMRQILVDHARARARGKRDGGVQVSLTLADGEQWPADDNLLLLEQELTALEQAEPRVAQITELHYFGGMTHTEIGEVVGLSRASVGRELRFARAWLADRMAAS